RHTRWPRDWSSVVCSSDLVVTFDQDIAGQLGDWAEAWKSSGQDENGPHQHDHHPDPDQDLAEAAYVRMNPSRQRAAAISSSAIRSEERRVGKYGRLRLVAY